MHAEESSACTDGWPTAGHAHSCSSLLDALDRRTVIAQATGVVMMQLQISYEQATAWLITAAHHTGIPLPRVADAVLRAA